MLRRWRWHLKYFLQGNRKRENGREGFRKEAGIGKDPLLSGSPPTPHPRPGLSLLVRLSDARKELWKLPRHSLC